MPPSNSDLSSYFLKHKKLPQEACGSLLLIFNKGDDGKKEALFSLFPICSFAAARSLDLAVQVAKLLSKKGDPLK